MKILYVINALTMGGAQKRVLNLIRHFRGRGHEVVVACFRGGDLESEFAATGARIVLLPGGFFKEILAIPAVVRLIHQGIDLVHTHLFSASVPGRLGALAARFLGRRAWVVTTVHGPEKERYRILEPCLRWINDEIITVSKYLRDEYHRGYPWIRVIPGGVPDPGPAGAAFRNAGRIGPRRICTIGRLARVKGFDIFLEALSILLKRGNGSFRAFVIGAGPEMEPLMRRAEVLRLDGVVRFTGRARETHDILKNMDLMVVPSRVEGQSLSMVEAMAAGLPFVASRVGGIPECVDHMREGILVRPSDPSALAGAIERLMADPALSMALGKMSRERYEREFTLGAMIDRVEAAYGGIPGPGEKRRVLLAVSSAGIGGGERNALYIARHLQREFWDPWAVISGPGRLKNAFEAMGIRTVVVPMGDNADAISLIQLVFLMKRGRFHLCHAHLNRAALLCSLAGRITRTPVLATVHGLNRGFYYRFANRVVAVSGASAEAVRSGGVDPGKIDVVMNGIPATGTSVPEQGAEKTMIFSTHPPRFTFGMVCKLHPNKGIATAIRAIGAMVNAGTDCALEIAGEGSSAHQAVLVSLAGELGVGERVFFLGHAEEPWALMRRWTALVIASEKEACPYVCLEAMGEGIPVAATRVGGIPEILEEGVNGLLFDPGDHTALASHLRALALDPDFFRTLGEAGRMKVSRDFTLEKNLTAIFTIYDEMVGVRQLGIRQSGVRKPGIANAASRVSEVHR